MPPGLMDSTHSITQRTSPSHPGGQTGAHRDKLRTSSGDSCRDRAGPGDRERIRNQLILGGALDDLSITDLYGDSASKSRKSSGFSETTKSRNCSGLDGDKSRNCSGNSISQGLASAGFLSHGGSNPMN